MRAKGVVVEIAGRDKVIVLTQRGEFCKVPFAKPVCVGQEIQFVRKRRLGVLHFSLAALLVVSLASSSGLIRDRLRMIPGGSEPAYYVTLSINPRIELALNHGQRVVAIEGLNDNGRVLVSKLQVVGRDLGQALEEITRQVQLEGLLMDATHSVDVTIAIKIRDASTEDLESKKHDMVSTMEQLEQVVREILGRVSQPDVRICQTALSAQ